MPREYNERAMLAMAHMYSPAHLAHRNIRPGNLILVRRVNISWHTSTLLLVAEVDVTNSDILTGTLVAVIPTSELPEGLHAHLMRIHDADNVMKSHIVRQRLSAMAQCNGPVTPLTQHINANDRVFVRPTSGSIRKYLLDDHCPAQLCRNGACAGRAQMHQRFSFSERGHESRCPPSDLKRGRPSEHTM